MTGGPRVRSVLNEGSFEPGPSHGDAEPDDPEWQQEDTEQDEQGREVLVVYCPREEMEFRVPVVEPGAQRIQQIQEELVKLLFAQAD